MRIVTWFGAVVLVATHTLACETGTPAVEEAPDGGAATDGGGGGAVDDALTLDASSDGSPHDGGAADTSPTGPHGCVTTVSAGHHVHPCDGVRYDVEVSAACASGGCGLVLDVHGLTMNADQQDDNTSLRALGSARGYVVVQPTAPTGVIGPSWNPATDDDKVWAFVRDAIAAFAIDPKRVHVTGFSQGGAMTFRLVCKHAAEIASAAPIAAADAKSLSSNTPPFRLDCGFEGTDMPSRPVPMLHMHGVKDGLVPIAKGRQQRDAILAWMGETTTQVLVDATTHQWTRYTSATHGVYEYLEHQYVTSSTTLAVPIAGHCFPGGKDLSGTLSRPLYFTCTPPTSFVWGEIVLDFFASHAN